MQPDQGSKLNLDAVLLLTIAHDLRNPLATLQHLVYLMEHQPDPKYLQQIKTQLHLCESVVGNVLALAGLEHSDKERVPVSDLVGNALALLSMPSDLALTLPDSPLFVWVDRAQVTQALLNLLRNAVEAEGQGSIEIAVLESAGLISIRIADRGPGFPASVLQAGLLPVVSSKKDGLGIGLAAAAQMIRANRGRIVLENRPEGGACCSMILPSEA